MNSWEKERAEQAAADQAEEERVAREERRYEEETQAEELRLRDKGLLPPYVFADEHSQCRAEDEERYYSKLDDYAAWQDEAVGAEQRFR